MSLHIGGGGGGGVISLCIKFRFVFLMLQIKVIDCNNTYLLGALRVIPQIFTQNPPTPLSAHLIYKKQTKFIAIIGMFGRF